jgi:hypothetical protein
MPWCDMWGFGEYYSEVILRLVEIEPKDGLNPSLTTLSHSHPRNVSWDKRQWLF